MNTRDLLQPFCAVGEARYFMNHIITQDDYLYATDGIVMVSVPDDGTVETFPEVNAAAPDCGRILQREKFAAPGFIPLRLPDNLQDAPKCPACGGAGTVPEQAECDGCDGEGDFPHDGHWYACQSCDGSGNVSDPGGAPVTCLSCDGTGKGMQIVTLDDGRKFQAAYLKKLLALPGIEYLPETSTADGTPFMRFRFDGGIGAMMPVSP